GFDVIPVRPRVLEAVVVTNKGLWRIRFSIAGAPSPANTGGGGQGYTKEDSSFHAASLYRARVQSAASRIGCMYDSVHKNRVGAVQTPLPCRHLRSGTNNRAKFRPVCLPICDDDREPILTQLALTALPVPRLRFDGVQGPHGDGGDERHEEYAENADGDGEHPGNRPLRREIAVADGEAGNESEVDALGPRPTLEVRDCYAKQSHAAEKAGQDGPGDLQAGPQTDEEKPPRVPGFHAWCP